MHEEIKRLFFGIEIHAPWPPKLPPGRLLDVTHRHLTLAFLGNIPVRLLLALLETFPIIPMRIGTAGYFDSCETLPPRHSHVIAWHARWLDDHHSVLIFQKNLTDWLLSHHYSLDTRPWNPHVTLCRQPFDPQAWKKAFTSLPFYTGAIHLYESIGNLNYIPLWSYPVKFPFEEIDHVADMAFIIRGETLEQLYRNAFICLAFKAPEYLNFFIPLKPVHTLDEIIITLNAILTNVDMSVGCPMKAVSFHGEIVHLQDSSLQWEMIVDV
jgi:RNA 2',3'-cyclic 3'-phosphodiesterase